MVWVNRGKHLFIDPAQATSEAPFLFDSDVIKIALFTATLTIDIDLDDHFDDLTGELVATSYVSRGLALASKVSNQDNTNDRGEWDAADLVFTIGNGGNGTFTQLCVVREPDAGATDANTEVVAHSAAPSTLTNGGNITLVWDAEGILHITT